MQQIFIELYSYRASWHALPAGERRRFADLILADAQGLTEHGVEVVGWGMNDPDTDRRAPGTFSVSIVYPAPSFNAHSKRKSIHRNGTNILNK
jgi:hypothetical protein